MGIIGNLVGRISMFFILFGVVLLTGTYRGYEFGDSTMPLIGGSLVVLGLVLFGGLRVVDLG